jgi:Rps23 Pro-64 3,4-dihydroxylase Tpa1-like proline 4-hydroxylase
MNEKVNLEKVIKIDEKHLDNINNNEDCLKYFGSWINNIKELKTKFINAQPFEHVVIDNFLEPIYAEKLHNLFPTKFDNWHTYMNPIEVKYAYDNINLLPEELKDYFYFLSSNTIIDTIRNLTDINNLSYDEYLHGAGLHCHPTNGRLNIHLDYEKHPYSGKERRINIIYFLSKHWEPEWNGQNELWDETVSNCVTKTDIKFNRAIIFKTNDISWHGLPEKIQCPENVFRKSLAYYYVSPLNSQKPEESYRKKAKYVKRPNDFYDEKLEKLYKIRPHRRITKEDMDTYFPNWTISD